MFSIFLAAMKLLEQIDTQHFNVHIAPYMLLHKATLKYYTTTLPMNTMLGCLDVNISAI